MLNTMSRMRGQGRSVGYPQTEGMLGDCMTHYGQELGAASEFGKMSVSTLPADKRRVSTVTVKNGGKPDVKHERNLEFQIQTVVQLVWTIEPNPHEHT